MKTLFSSILLFIAIHSHASGLESQISQPTPLALQSHQNTASPPHIYTCKGIWKLMDKGGPGNDPMMLAYSDDGCVVERNGPIQSTYNAIMGQVLPQFRRVESNYKELITQFIYNAAAQADANVKNISANMTGLMKMRIDGVVDSQGYVPVTFSNFGMHGVGKLRKYQLGMKIHIYINIKYNNLVVKGKYNVHTGQLIATPSISSYQPEVYTKVKLPFFLKILDDLIPEIFNKLQTEFGRIVTDVFEFFGVDMSQSIPQAIQHIVNIEPETFVQIKPLNGYNVGEHVLYELNVRRGFVSMKDGDNTISIEYMHTPRR